MRPSVLGLPLDLVHERYQEKDLKLGRERLGTHSMTCAGLDTTGELLPLVSSRPLSGCLRVLSLGSSHQHSGLLLLLLSHSVVSDSVRPHPWDSPGKNTGVGCHFLLQRIRVKSESEVAQSCLTFGDPMDCSPPGSSVHEIFQARALECGAIALEVKAGGVGLVIFPEVLHYPLFPFLKPF